MVENFKCFDTAITHSPYFIHFLVPIVCHNFEDEINIRSYCGKSAHMLFLRILCKGFHILSSKVSRTQTQKPLPSVKTPYNSLDDFSWFNLKS